MKEDLMIISLYAIGYIEKKQFKGAIIWKN